MVELFALLSYSFPTQETTDNETHRNLMVHSGFRTNAPHGFKRLGAYARMSSGVGC
jgi:hypothetical protein